MSLNPIGKASINGTSPVSMTTLMTKNSLLAWAFTFIQAYHLVHHLSEPIDLQ